MAETENDQISAHIAVIAAAYLGNPSNPVERHQIVEVIREISSALTTPTAPEVVAEDEKPKLSPAAIRKSITHEHLISFIDNKPYKSLKRHLGVNGHTPKSYREHFGLKPDYPMTAPSYSEQRSALARKGGLGQQRPALAATPAPMPAAEPAAQAPAAQVKAAKPPAVKAAPTTLDVTAPPPAVAKASAKRTAPKAAATATPTIKTAPKTTKALAKTSGKRTAAKA